MDDERTSPWEDLERHLREAARELHANRIVDDHEIRHLMRVVNGCSLIQTDVYSPDRISRVMQSDRSALSSIVGHLIEEERRGGGEVLFRIRRLPDDVRLVGEDVDVRGQWADRSVEALHSPARPSLAA